MPLRILHCLRAPVGGLFRHVCDLARAQGALGHHVGLICDSMTGGDMAAQALADLEPHCTLGISRMPIGRLPGLSDLNAIRAVSALAKARGVDVLHGHGAKGGAYARLASFPGRPGRQARRFYTPHGGSLHYSRGTASGLVFLTLERLLLSRTDGLIFESEYGMRTFAHKVGAPSCPQRVIHNGLRPDEFAPVSPAADAADLLFIGELRILKGIGDLLKAIALLKDRGERLSALIVGSGGARDEFVAQASALGIAEDVEFKAAMPARDAFAKGRILIVPSLAESLPYIVLEAAAAGLPLIATRVGGIPEIFGSDAGHLVSPGDSPALAAAISAARADPGGLASRTDRLQKRVRKEFSLEKMCDDVLAFYAQAGRATTAAR